MQELRTAYLKSLANKVTELGDAISARNFKTVARLGHQMKGSGCSYGLPEISDLGARIEDAGENRRVSLLEPLLAEFMAFMNQTLTQQAAQENP
jgi:HPt (histidine-containing phosphotransfer) domain-containing protein